MNRNHSRRLLYGFAILGNSTTNSGANGSTGVKVPCKPSNFLTGFTLVELLIALVLMTMLMGITATIFYKASEVSTTDDARGRIYRESEYAFKKLYDDLHGCISFNYGLQKFVMENGSSRTDTGAISYDTSAATEDSTVHTSRAADRLTFRTTTLVGDATQTIEVTYELKPETIDKENQFTVRSKRPIYVLKRRIRGQNPNDSNVFDQAVKDKKGKVIDDPLDLNGGEELTHYVISFNIEYYANNSTYSQLDPSPCQSSDPLGDNDKGGGTNDTSKAITIKQIRITMIVVSDSREVQERCRTQVINIPVG